MLAVRMTSDVEKRTAHRLPLVALFQNATIAHLAELIDGGESSAIQCTLVPLSVSRKSQVDAKDFSFTKPPLFCIHPAGGTVFCYRELAEQLHGQESNVTGRDVYGLQANGIDGNRPPHETLAEMAAHYARVIRETVPAGRVHLAGWSLGGNIAFEVARQLKQRGTDVGVLALLDSGRLSPDEAFDEQDFLPLLSALFPETMNLDLEAIRQKSQDDQLQFFIDRASQAGIVPDELNAETLAANDAMHIFGVFQANVKAVHEHVAEDYDGDIHLFRPQDQSKTNQLFDDPALGWGNITRTVHLHAIPGDHAHMLQSPAVIDLADQLNNLMTETDVGSRNHSCSAGGRNN